MDVIRKDATITNVDDAYPGTFQVVLSAPTRDRDGDTLLADEWKIPLPDHITFDIDHEMSVRGTVGSGKPWIDYEGVMGAGKGAMIVDGRYSSLQQAQDARTLVNEGHINKTSVAFMSEKTQKDGKSHVTRELLNGAFVAVPSNREAVILSSKGMKSGRRNSTSDQAHLDAIARHAIALGATVTGGDDENDEDVAASKAATGVTLKSVVTDAIAAHQAGTLTADQALTLIRDAQSTGEPTGNRGTDDRTDSAAESAADAAATATADATDDATVDEKSVEQDLVTARKRFYSTLNSERNES